MLSAEAHALALILPCCCPMHRAASAELMQALDQPAAPLPQILTREEMATFKTTINHDPGVAHAVCKAAREPGAHRHAR
ncbi:MAG TPA: hypothetical protein VFV38_43540 [Ktedonobacteraceae bacterium]|nr:hypothetical protein [Ktedonobacteraceae bacterium]